MKVLLKGNEALVEGAIKGGLDAYFGYPITPQNEITELMSKRLRQENKVFLQTESELSSINMVFGAAICGKRTLTSSSSPGISLMQEGISYLVGCELPSVIINVQRGGPGLGNISGAQSDYFQAVKGGGHGDYRMIVLTPANITEMYEMAYESFSLAFKYRNPVMILTDGVLGQMVEPANIKPLDNESVSEKKVEDLGWNLTGAEDREPRMIRSLVMAEGQLEEHNYKLWKKYQLIAKEEVSWEEIDVENAKLILIGYGTSARIIYDAYKRANERGWEVGYFRPKRVWPFPSKRINELSHKAKLFVVEMSMGQMLEDVQIASKDPSEVMFYGRPGGGLPEVDEILKKIESVLLCK